MPQNPVRKGQVKLRQDGWWSSYNSFALDEATVAAARFRLMTCARPWGIAPMKNPRSINP